MSTGAWHKSGSMPIMCLAHRQQISHPFLPARFQQGALPAAGSAGGCSRWAEGGRRPFLASRAATGHSQDLPPPRPATKLSLSKQPLLLPGRDPELGAPEGKSLQGRWLGQPSLLGQPSPPEETGGWGDGSLHVPREERAMQQPQQPGSSPTAKATAVPRHWWAPTATHGAKGKQDPPWNPATGLGSQSNDSRGCHCPSASQISAGAEACSANRPGPQRGPLQDQARRRRSSSSSRWARGDLAGASLPSEQTTPAHGGSIQPFCPRSGECP